VFPVRLEHHLRIISKAIPVRGRGGPKECDLLRILHCLDNLLTDGNEVVNFTHRPCSTILKHFLFLSLLLIFVGGLSAAGKIRQVENFIDLIGSRTRDIPACSIVPQTLLNRIND
jgi:hypothetical protein